jgi:hypothetical protein
MIALPYPDKALWPNGRAHWGKKAAEVKKHKRWAYDAMRAASFCVADSPIPVRIVCHPKAKGPAPDRDNIIAAAKAYLDGIADYLCVNDRHFAAPTVEIAPERSGQFIISIGEEQ